jgi:putative ABC transport system ATP-binding protein
LFIQAGGLKKSYKTGDVVFTALHETSFGIEKGEIAVILGPSGSGKSTLLNIIGGIDRADQGVLTVDGLDVIAMSEEDLTLYRRESIGFIFQFYNLIPNLTVAENVEVAAHVCRDPWPIDLILEAVGMKELKNRFPRELSGGQQQRVSIARALVKKPRLLLCDEPTGALDYETSKEMLQLISSIRQEHNTTVLIITHNTAIADMADRVLRLRNGEVVENRFNEQPLPAERIEW